MSGWKVKKTPEERRERHLQQMKDWKALSRDYYLFQKRIVSSRPEYLAVRRQHWADKRDKLIEEGVLPKKQGRPKLYHGDAAVERRREINRAANKRYKERKKMRSSESDIFSTHEENNDNAQIESKSESRD